MDDTNLMSNPRSHYYVRPIIMWLLKSLLNFDQIMILKAISLLESHKRDL
jgi:hypothetical protein